MAVVMIRIVDRSIAAGKKAPSLRICVNWTRRLSIMMCSPEKSWNPEAWACNESWNISGRMR